MKTLTGNAEAQRLLAANSPRFIVEIDWDLDDSYSGLYADQSFSISGNAYLPYVQDWQDLRVSLDLKSVGSTDDFRVIMKQALGAAFWTLAETNNAEGKPIRIGFTFDGLATADIVWLFQGHIKAINEHSRRGTRLDCIEFGRKLQRELPLREVNLDRFPKAPQEAIGRMIPIIYGRCPYIPGIPVLAWPSAILYDTHTDTDTTIRLTSMNGIPWVGSVKIGAEEIYYRGSDLAYDYGGETIAVLLDCERGHNGTTAAPHEGGVDVTVVGNHYYLFADHACSAIRWTLVNRKQPAGTYTSYNASTTFRRDASSYAAHIAFDGRPMYRQYSKTVEVHKVFPNELAGDNAATDTANAIDELEAESFAVVDAANTPLSVNHTTDITGFKDSKGAIVEARIAVEFDTTKDFAAGEITATWP